MTSDLERAIARHRRALAAGERASRLTMRRAYRDAISSLQGDLRRAQDRIDAIRASGQRVPAWRLLQEAQIRQLIAQAEFAFSGFGATVAREVRLRQREAVARAGEDARALIGAGFGTAPPGATLPIVRLPERSLVHLVGALQPDSPLARVLADFAGSAVRGVEAELVGGMAAGKNGREIAAAIVDRFGLSLTRAETIVRTETHRAYRAATLDTLRENRHLLKGWRWSSARDERTCPVCLALDGRVFKLDEPMRAHPNCRCAVVPVTKSWKDLGFDVEESTPARQSGAEWFREQPATIQRGILGPAAYRAYKAGRVDLSDFIRVDRSAEWGSSYVRMRLDGALAKRRRAA